MIYPALAAIGASITWATAIVIAQAPARALGAFAFTRLQLIVCSGLLALVVIASGQWSTLDWAYWPAFAISAVFGILLGNLAMIGCLRRGGPRRTELLLCLKAPLVAVLGFLWLNEGLTLLDGFGGIMTWIGIAIAVGAPATDAPSDKLDGSLWVVLLLGGVAVACQGVGFLSVKPAMTAGASPLAVSAIRLLGAAVLITAISPFLRNSAQPDTAFTLPLAVRTIIPGIMGYVVASTLLLFAIANMTSGLAVVLGSLSPIVVLPILWIKDGQPPSFWAIAGAGLAVAGTALILLA